MVHYMQMLCGLIAGDRGSIDFAAAPFRTNGELNLGFFLYVTASTGT